MNGLKTKKVTTYGRKKTQIISVRSDFSPIRDQRPVKQPDSPISISSSSSRSPSPIAKPKSRPPLTAKLSQNILPTKAVRPAKERAKGKYVESPPSSPESPVFLKRPTAYGRKKVIPKSPSFELPTAPVMDTPKPRERIDCIEVITSVQRVRGVKERKAMKPKRIDESLDLVQRLETMSIDPQITEGLITKTQDRESAATASTGAVAILMDELLSICSSLTIHPFTEFLGSPALLNLVHPSGKASPKYQKIGEASYSEVFGLSRGEDDIIVKVIPLNGHAGSSEGDIPECSDEEDVLREIQTTKRMSQLPGGGFVTFLGAFILEGRYPQTLLDEWDVYDANFRSRSTRPGSFTNAQRYALVVLNDGGDDLESFKFDNHVGWIQAASAFWQVVDTLARAEEEVNFEHRDLHEGQILLSPVTPTGSTSNFLSPEWSGVKITIIDFGLSRLDTSSGIAHAPLPEEVYEGVGNQWDVYRSMRDEVKDDWEAFHPITNLMWLNYILRYIIYSKSLRRPSMRSERKPGVASSPLRPAKRIPLTKRKAKPDGKDAVKSDTVRAYESLKEMEGLLGAALKMSKRIRSVDSARDVLAMGREKGWIC